MKYLSLILLIVASNASATSFDCQKAAIWVEKEICSNDMLSRLDDALDKNYQGSLGTNIGEGALKDLKKTQLEWFKARNSCKTATCIEKKYRERIDALCNYPAISGVNWGCSATSDEIQ
jgi:uncharacterized protein